MQLSCNVYSLAFEGIKKDCKNHVFQGHPDKIIKKGIRETSTDKRSSNHKKVFN